MSNAESDDRYQDIVDCYGRYLMGVDVSYPLTVGISVPYQAIDDAKVRLKLGAAKALLHSLSEWVTENE